MKVYVASCPAGVFASDEKGKILDKVIFDGEFCGSELDDARALKLSRAERELLAKLRKDNADLKDSEIIFEIKKEGYAHEFPNACGETLRNFDLLVHAPGLKKDQLKEMFLKASYESTREKLKTSASTDRMIIQAVSAIDEVEKVANLLTIRLREWYSYYFPELSYKTSDNEKFVRAVVENPERKDSKLYSDEETIGSEVPEKDIKKMHELAKAIMALYDEKAKLEDYIEKRVKEFMPNANEVIGPIVAARMLAQAGDLKRLSSFPSSTIQVLGAERALFRFLHGVGTPPKHGLLFQCPAVNQAPRELRGKAARVLASKASIAVKVDYFKGEFIGDKLRADFEKRMRSLGEAKPKAPGFKERGEQRGRDGKGRDEKSGTERAKDNKVQGEKRL